jgi:hypothetical protein
MRVYYPPEKMRTYYSLGEMEVVRNEKDYEIERLRTREARLREALAFYARCGVVSPDVDDAIMEDGGDRARAALGEEKKG